MKKKFDDTTRVQVFEARRQGKTLQEISTDTGVSLTTIKQWLSEAIEQGDKSIAHYRKLSVAKQAEILAEYKQCGSPKAICEKYHIPKSTLLTWKKRASVVVSSQAETCYIAGELHKIKRDIEQLRIENEIFRVCRCSTVSSISEKVD